jgi:hypothetical protein
MAVQLITAVERYQGLSSDSKPGSGGVPAPSYVGASFTELDTGSSFSWDGAVWRQATVGQNAVAAGGPGPQGRQQLSVFDEILLELRRLRQGLIQAPDCICTEIEGDLTPNEE